MRHMALIIIRLLSQSTAAGFHHCSWDVASLEEVGLGAMQMLAEGWDRGWGVGRHVLGSNYFYYVRDPWGSYCEYSYDIDYIPAGLSGLPPIMTPKILCIYGGQMSQKILW
jgi:hypothetical protein